MPSVSNITSPTQVGVQDNTQSTKSDKAKNDVDKDMFMKLLVAQLKYQDPLNPSDPSQFLAQTAQFTTVEKLSVLAEESTKSAFGNRVTTASSMIGKAVSFLGTGGQPTVGTVVSARITDDNSIKLNLGSGVEISLEEVKAFGQPAAPPANAPAPAPTPDPKPAQLPA